MKYILTMTLFIALGSSNLLAESDPAPEAKRGLITTANCPYSCKDAGIPKQSCREWRRGDLCEVEDLSQAPGHRTLARVPSTGAESAPKAKQTGHIREWRDTTGTWAAIPTSALTAPPPSAPADPNAHGLITTANCPYNCKMAKLPSNVCREWRKGDLCEIEDLTQAPGHRTLARMPGR